jgi:hypothetical protein
MNIFCRLLGHTWLHKTEDPKISWNTAKSLSELHLTADGEPRFWLQCERCGDRNENPTREDLKRAM